MASRPGRKTKPGPRPAVKPPRPAPDDRTSNVSAALDAFAGMADEADGDDGLWREAMRDLDAQRPQRPLFEGMY